MCLGPLGALAPLLFRNAYEYISLYVNTNPSDIIACEHDRVQSCTYKAKDLVSSFIRTNVPQLFGIWGIRVWTVVTKCVVNTVTLEERCVLNKDESFHCHFI
jgi:hypothetical protein